MDAAANLAENAAAATFDRLPAAVVEATKRFTLSTLGSAIAGSAVRGCEPIVQLFAEWGGRPESTVIGAAERVPAPHAAFLNAMHVQASDFDDVHDGALVRPYSIVVPAALATAQRIGRVSGREYITAVAVGVDVTCRLGRAAQAGVMNWTRPSTLGVFGAAAAAARLLGLDSARTLDALGIAYSQVAGTSQAMIDRAMVKRVHPGFAARAGVTAALFAQRGITGPVHPLEGQYGYFSLYEGGHYDRALLLERLGTHWCGVEVTLKAYPSAGFVHAPTDGALTLAARHDIRPEQVRAIRLWVTPLAFDLGARPYPPEQGSVGVAAFASVAYGVATALLHRSVTLANYTEQAVVDPRALRLVALTSIEVQPGAEGRYLTPATIEIATADGACHRETVTAVRGHPDRPLTWEEVVAKFRDCCAFGAPPVDRPRREAVVTRVAALERLDDVGKLVAALGAPARPA